MAPSPHPQLTHVGIYARDLATMEAFYTKVLGLIVSDRGSGMTFKNDFVFMSAKPGTHHQLVMASGRPPQGASTVNQLSFKVDTLDELKEMHRRVDQSPATNLRPVNHGNALSLYFDDPEGNTVEIYMDTQWHVPQPHAVKLDFALPNDAILAETEARCRATPGFMPMEAYKEVMAKRLAAQG
jgi:catechol 2,3-dioxygenase